MIAEFARRFRFGHLLKFFRPRPVRYRPVLVRRKDAMASIYSCCFRTFLSDLLSEMVRFGLQLGSYHTKLISNIRCIVGDAPQLDSGHTQKRNRLLFCSGQLSHLPRLTNAASASTVNLRA